ncbi:MAG: PAS domain S-box protein [Spirochaetia bacterium]|nr:PAS domain S-box protein [Spirochaetia bacterium]
MQLGKKHLADRTSFMISKLFLITIIAAMGVLSLLVWRGQATSQRSKIADANSTAALIIARNMEIRFQGVSQALERLALATALDVSAPDQSWMSEAGHYMSTFPSIIQLHLFNKNLKLLTGYPDDSASVSLEDLEDDIETITLVYPIYDGAQLNGFLIGSIDIRQVIESAYGKYENLFELQLKDDERIVWRSGDRDQTDSTIRYEEQIVFDQSNSMTMVITPTVSYIRQEMALARNTLTFLIIITIIIGIIVWIAQKNHALSNLNLRQYRELLENVQLIAMTVSIQGEITFSNDYMSRVTGYRTEELKGSDLCTLLFPHISTDDRARFFQRLRQGGVTGHKQITITIKDGTERTWALNNTLLKNTQGAIIGFASMGDDITEQLESHKTLFLQSSALASAADGIAILDLSDRIEWGNEALFELIGYEPSEVIGNRFKDLIRSEKQDDAFFEAIREYMHTGRVWRGELENRRKDGTPYTEYMTITPVRDSSETISHFIAIKRDITEQKQLEQQNRQLAEQFEVRQRIESLGKLAGGIAHDFNNLLVPVIGYADLGMLEVDPESDAYDHLSHIREAGERAADLTRQILAFGRKQRLNLQVLDLNQLIAEFQQMLRLPIGEEIELTLQLTEEPIRIEADRSQMEQILMNLVVNAKDAMPDGGLLTIETAVVHNGSEAQASLTVRDTGTGMTEELQQHMFEPFYTTKPQGSGTGLGLSTVFGIVKQHHGNIAVNSQPGKGTECTITLALAEMPAVTRPSDEFPADRRQHGRETIIVVEDTSEVLELVTQVLRSAGYTVLPFRNPTDGLKAAVAAGQQADLILSDILMPQLDGITLLQRIRAVRPGQKALFMSGYADEQTGIHMQEHADVRLLQKPFTTEQLLMEVRRAIEA